jgi:hypothetical protein
LTEQLQISAKNLGEVALTDFCPKCFWIKLHLKNRLPFQIFPGIFSSIDAYTKKMIHSWWDGHQYFPAYLNNLGKITGYKKIPSSSKFRIWDKDSNIWLTGIPDEILVREDLSHIILDYKTAKYTGTQDSLMPIYEVQLNGYALIGETCELKPVTELALVYFEPLTDVETFSDNSNHRDDGFALGFKANIHKVRLETAMIPPLLMRVREIYELNKVPEGKTGCKNCECLNNLIGLL